MIRYEVLEYFTDLQDNSYPYNVGDIYPREGYKPTWKRTQELASSKNIRKKPIIKAIKDTVEVEQPETDNTGDINEVEETVETADE